MDDQEDRLLLKVAGAEALRDLLQLALAAAVAATRVLLVEEQDAGRDAIRAEFALQSQLDRAVRGW